MPDTLRNLGILGGVALLAAGGATWYLSTQQHASERPAATAPANPEPAAAPPANLDAQAPAPAASQAAPVAPDTRTTVAQQPGAPGEPGQAAPTNLDAAPTSQSPPTPWQAPTAAPQSAQQAQSSAPEPSPDIWPQGVTPKKFTALPRAFTLQRDSAAYVAPDLASPRMYSLPVNTPVYSVERSTDGGWVIAMTEDGKAAYLPAADLGPYDPTRAPAPVLPANVTGTAKVLDTATLIVNGQRVTLSGIRGLSGAYARGLQSAIDSQGRTANCDLQQSAYLCKSGTGVDVASEALINGAAQPADDATDAYRKLTDDAQANHRGIWKH